MTPVFASRNWLLQAPSKKPEREHRIARCTAHCFELQVTVRSEYFPPRCSLAEISVCPQPQQQQDETNDEWANMSSLWADSMVRAGVGSRRTLERREKVEIVDSKGAGLAC